MGSSKRDWENPLRVAAVLAALAATYSFVVRAGDALTTRVLELGVVGAWTVPLGLVAAVVLCSSSSVPRASLALGASLPALGHALYSGEAAWTYPLFTIGVLSAVAFVAAVALRSVRRRRDATSLLLGSTSVVCGLLLVAALALCWWWPVFGSGGVMRGRLAVSPFHVLAATFFSLSARQLLRRDTRGAFWLVVGHIAFAAAPHHGGRAVGCMHAPGPGLIESAWPAVVLGLCWAYRVHRRAVTAAVTDGSSSV